MTEAASSGNQLTHSITSNEHTHTMSNDNSSDFLSTATLDGGVTRVTLSRPNQGNDANTARAHEAAMTGKAGVTTTDHGGNASYRSIHLGADVGTPSESGAITSARTRAGMPRSGKQITADDIVSIAGMETRIQDAITAGAVVQNPDGTFSMVGGSPAKKR